MKELKSKRNGKIHIISDEEYDAIIRKGVFPINKFTVTELRLREIVPMKVGEPIIKKKKKE